MTAFKKQTTAQHSLIWLFIFTIMPVSGLSAQLVSFASPVNLDSTTQAIEPVDLDGDGDPDLVVFGDSISIVENLGGGTLAASTFIGLAFGFHGQTVDLDGDGDRDILGQTISKTIGWYENLGSLAFSGPQKISSAPLVMKDLITHDLDGDGDEDVIICGNTFTNWIAWLENLGPASFSPPKLVATGLNQLWELEAADLDGDGDAEILSVSNPFKIFENQDTIFSLGITFTSGPKGRAIDVADFDMDGDIDIVTCVSGNDGIGDGKVKVHENLGGFSFNNTTITSTAEGAYDVQFMDLNNDGYVEVVSASDSKDLAVHRNRTDGTFGSPRIIPDFDPTGEINAADWDSDGDIDLFNGSNFFENLFIDVLVRGFSGFSTSENIVSLAPNPATNYMIVLGKGLASLHDMAGKLHWQKEINGQCYIEVQDFPSGIYFLSVRSQYGDSVTKVIIN